MERKKADVFRQVVGLVCGDQDATGMRPQNLGDLQVSRVHARLNVDDQHDGVRLIDRGLDLLSNCSAQNVFVTDPPTRVHQPEVMSSPVGWSVMAVARHAGSVIYNCATTTHDSIEQR
jgi:hypothetical protein